MNYLTNFHWETKRDLKRIFSIVILILVTLSSVGAQDCLLEKAKYYDTLDILEFTYQMR